MLSARDSTEARDDALRPSGDTAIDGFDRTSRFAFAELHERATRRVAADFRRRLIATVPYRIHTVLADDGAHLTVPKGDGGTAADVKQLLAETARFRCHSFALACAQKDIDHRLIKPHHPWKNGQGERMNRTIKDATTRRHHYESHKRLLEHFETFSTPTPSPSGS